MYQKNVAKKNMKHIIDKRKNKRQIYALVKDFNTIMYNHLYTMENNSSSLHHGK